MVGDQAFSPAEVARPLSLIAQDLSTGDSIACGRENTDLIHVLNLSVLVYISLEYIPPLIASTVECVLYYLPGGQSIMQEHSCWQ